MSWGNGQPLEGCSWSADVLAGVAMAVVITFGSVLVALGLWLG